MTELTQVTQFKTQPVKFEQDILISYAHIDDAPLIEGQKGWISEFHRSLEVRLAQLLGKKPRIWRDPKLQGNDYFADEILSQFPQIALLVSVLSPRYVKSEWCVKEVSQFFEVSKKNIGIRVRNKSRIFKIIKTPVRREEHPEMMRDLLGYEFYRLDPETGRAKELSKIFGSEHEQAYWQKLDDLAHDIRELLETMSAEDRHAETAPADIKKNVYLAETTSDLREHRESLKRELQQHGYRILPDHTLPLTVGDLAQATQHMLEQSILSVHLVGRNYGIVPEGTKKSLIELQHDLAAERSHHAALRRLTWLVPGSTPDDTRQTAFIQRLKTDPAAQAGADLLVTSLEEVKLAVLGELNKLERKPAQPLPASDPMPAAGPPRIYLICDQKDLENGSVKPLEDHLFTQKFEVILPVFEGDETQVRIEHQENLKACTGVIIHAGSGNEFWLRSKLRDLVKVAGYGRTTPLQAKAVYLAAPASAQKERFRSHEIAVINGLAGFDASLMKDFIHTVNMQAGTTKTSA